MEATINQRNILIRDLLNGTYQSIEHVIPLESKMNKPNRIESFISIEYGVLIGITGDIKGKLVLTGTKPMFASIGLAMFQMPVEGEMLTSFSGELGNMIAGNLSTNIDGQGYKIDITHPSILEGNSRISGFKQAIQLKLNIETAGELDIFLLVD